MQPAKLTEKKQKQIKNKIKTSPQNNYTNCRINNEKLIELVSVIAGF